jgi:hypothetical protein
MNQNYQNQGYGYGFNQGNFPQQQVSLNVKNFIHNYSNHI